MVNPMTSAQRNVLLVKLSLPGWYKKYLRSPIWLIRRNQIVAERKSCEVCGDTEKLEVHHLSYEHLFDEPDEELLLTCDLCHETIHWLGDRSIVKFGPSRSTFFEKLDAYLEECVRQRNLTSDEKMAEIDARDRAARLSLP